MVALGVHFILRVQVGETLEDNEEDNTVYQTLYKHIYSYQKNVLSKLISILKH